MDGIHRDNLVQLAPSVRERVLERLETLRMIAVDVVNGAEGMKDEELVRWTETLHTLAKRLVHVAMH